MGTHDVCATDDVALGTSRGFEVAGYRVLVCRSAAGVFAAENKCSHAALELDGGRVRGVHLFCPHHGARFDLRDGSTGGQVTSLPITVYPCAVDSGRVLVTLPD